MSLARHAIPAPPPSSRERQIRALARTNPSVAACLGLMDNNGLSKEEAYECLILELASHVEDLTRELVEASLARPPRVLEVPDRDDDGLMLCCRELDCRCRGGAA